MGMHHKKRSLGSKNCTLEIIPVDFPRACVNRPWCGTVELQNKKRRARRDALNNMSLVSQRAFAYLAVCCPPTFNVVGKQQCEILVCYCTVLAHRCGFWFVLEKIGFKSEPGNYGFLCFPLLFRANVGNGRLPSNSFSSLQIAVMFHYYSTTLYRSGHVVHGQAHTFFPQLSSVDPTIHFRWQNQKRVTL